MRIDVLHGACATRRLQGRGVIGYIGDGIGLFLLDSFHGWWPGRVQDRDKWAIGGLDVKGLRYLAIFPVNPHFHGFHVAPDCLQCKA